MNHRRESLSQPLIFRTRRGQLVAARQATVADTFLLAEFLGRLSDRARHLRYMSPQAASADVMWNDIVDPEICTTKQPGFGRMIA